jgi:hypothetical protein
MHLVAAATLLLGFTFVLYIFGEVGRPQLIALSPVSLDTLDHVRTSIPELVGIFKSTKTFDKKCSELPVYCSIFQIVIQGFDARCLFLRSGN